MYHLDPETLSLLRRVFDEVVADLPADHRSGDEKSRIAARILGLAAAGERSAERLRVGARLDRPACRAS